MRIRDMADVLFIYIYIFYVISRIALNSIINYFICHVTVPPFSQSSSRPNEFYFFSYLIYFFIAIFFTVTLIFVLSNRFCICFLGLVDSTLFREFRSQRQELNKFNFICQAQTSNENLSPPVVLLEHPPLASFTNAVLAALNDLRLCAPLGIAHSVTKCVQNSLGGVVTETTSFYR